MSIGASACVLNASKFSREKLDILLTLFVTEKSGAIIQLRFQRNIDQNMILIYLNPCIDRMKRRINTPRISAIIYEAWRKRFRDIPMIDQMIIPWSIAKSFFIGK
jgi:hypothetical protein